MSWPIAVWADDWALLGQPNTVALMRHALAPGTSDPRDFQLDDCATQRNLDERGRAQAREIGRQIRARDISFDKVLTSQWCRTRETATLLAIGPVEDAPALNSFFEDRASRDPQTKAALETITQSDAPLFLVTHQVNISALTGQGTSSGEILIAERSEDGLRVIGAINIAP